MPGIPSVLLSVLALAALVVAPSWAWARWWCRPRRTRSEVTPADRGLPWEPVELSSEGVRLRGWFVPAPATTGALPAAVVVAHGWSGSAADLLPLAAVLHAAGLAVLGYDARGHGNSRGDGPITILKLAQDVLAAVRYLRARPDVDESRVGVVGQSIGGGAAILAASAEPRIRAVVSCAAFADPEALTRAAMARMRIPQAPFGWLVLRFIERWLGTTFADVAPANRIGLVAAPVLLVHGASDRFVSPANMEALHARSRRERTERMLVPRRGHGSVLEDAACQGEIAAFLARNLSSEPPSAIDLDQALSAAMSSIFRQLGTCC